MAAGSAVVLTAAVTLAQPVVSNLRVAADASGSPLPQAEAPPGEKQYHLESGTNQLFVAFDCASPSEGITQVRVMQPPGTILFQEEASCAAGGQQVVAYDRQDQPFTDNEYVVNLYVGDKELYLADSVQFAVGGASIPPSQGDPTFAPPEPAATLQVASVPEQPQPGSAGATQPNVGGPSKWLLAVAGIGILALVAVVAWAGRSAARA
jgi:hypothetical protein